MALAADAGELAARAAAELAVLRTDGEAPARDPADGLAHARPKGGSLGFFLGGVTTYEADPGLGVLLVPIGALALVIALGMLVVQLFKA